MSTNGTYDVESFPISPKLKRALRSEEMRTAPVPIDELLKLSDIPRVWTVITKRTSITTNLVSINVDGCGASACTYSCNMKNKVRDTLLVMPRDVFPKSRAERLVGLRISTERDTDESHVISKSALSKLRSNLNSEFKQADRHSDQDKTLCGLEHIKVFKLPKGATWSHLIYCRVERSEAPRRLVQKLEGSSPAPFPSPFFTGIYLYDGVSEVRLVNFQEFNDASAIITPPTVSFSLDGLGDYIMYGSSYYEGQADHVFTLKHGFLEQITLFADGA